jgi:hypothetical protein
MPTPLAPFAPLTLAKLFGVPQVEVALRLRITPDWLRRLARDPRQAQRVVVAELEAILEQARAKAEASPVGCGAQSDEP